ncbi:MAG: plastocyanin/azurin family copper-binding protein [Thermoplasmatota archaeon]
MAKHSLPFLLAATAALLLSGCTSPAPSDSSPAADATVLMENFKFDPVELRVKVGDMVNWINKDAVQHTVTPTDKEQWGTEGSGDDQSKWLDEGDSWSFTFTEPGTYTYYCIPHASQSEDGEWKGMVATVVVSE